MSTPTLAIQGEVVQPSAVASPQAAAAFNLGQVLKEIIHAIPAAFSSENQVLAAFTAIDDFIKAFVTRSALPALADGTQRAPMEDVSKRIPPAGTAFSVPTNIPAIDYDKLAAAMVRAQAQYLQQNPPPVPPADEQLTEPDYGQPPV